MTTPRRDGCEEPWKAWIRSHERLDSRIDGIVLTDCDMWIHKYKSTADKISTREIQHIMLVECKTFGAKLPDAQRDTYNVIDCILRRQNGKIWKLPTFDGKPSRLVRCWGVHVWRMSNSTPDDSAWMLWDEKPITAGVLVGLLRFDIDPDTLRERSDRRHHTPSLAVKQQLRL